MNWICGLYRKICQSSGHIRIFEWSNAPIILH